MEMRELTCTICKKIFSSNRENALTCGNKKCVDRSNYLRHKDVYIENSRRWERLNPERRKVIRKKSLDKFRKNKPERFNELMMNGYRKNKPKWRCRNRTNTILKSVRYNNPLDKRCSCGSTESLTLNFELYPETTDGIKKAIRDGKILYKCKTCHKSTQSEKKHT